MTRFRHLRERSRRKLHEAMSLPAFYYPGGDRSRDPYPMNIRRHTEFGEQGDVKGTSFAYAEREAEIPQLIFDNEELKANGMSRPKNKSIVMFAEDEGYRIDSVLPPYGMTTKVRVSRLPTEEAAEYDFPEDP